MKRGAGFPRLPACRVGIMRGCCRCRPGGRPRSRRGRTRPTPWTTTRRTAAPGAPHTTAPARSPRGRGDPRTACPARVAAASLLLACASSPVFAQGLPGPRPTAGCVHAKYAWHVCNAAQCAQLQEQAVDCLYCMACYICTELCRLARAMRMSHDGDKHGASTGSCGSTVPRHSLVDNSTVSHDRRSCTHLLKRLSAVLGQTACLMLGTVNRAVSSTAEQTSKRNLKTARYKNSALST